MNRDHQWGLTPKRNGPEIKNVHDLRETTFSLALEMMVESETKRVGKKVSRRIILTDLSTKDSAFHRQKRAELRRLYTQLKKEHTTDASTHNNPKEKERT